MSDTPSPDVKDLELLVPVDIRCSFGRPEPRQFVVPGDMPLEPYLHVQTALLEDTDEVEGTKQLQHGLSKLLLWYVPQDDGETREFVRLQLERLGVRSIMKIINSIYEGQDDSDEGGDDDAKTEATVDAGPTSSATIQTETGPSQSEESPTPTSSQAPTTVPGSA